MQIIDLQSWKRREHYLLFKSYSNPFTGITANVDCTPLRLASKERGFPFSLGYLFAAMLAVNDLENLRIRLVDDLPVLFDHVHISITVARNDGTFGFSHHPFTRDFEEFIDQGRREYLRVAHSTELFSGHAGDDTIYATVVREVSFTSFEHAGRSAKSSVPLVAFGKAFAEGDTYKMPVSFHVHHALADGQDVGRFFVRLQEYLKKFS